MDVSRRSFLRGTLSVSAVAIIASRGISPHATLDFSGIPTLHGDGVTDDTAAFNATLSGQPVFFDGEIRHFGREIDGRREVYVPAGEFRVTTLDFTSLIALRGADAPRR